LKCPPNAGGPIQTNEKKEKEIQMRNYRWSILMFAVIVAMAVAGSALADSNLSQTIEIFKESPTVQPFFEDCYGYAVFPTIGKGGVGIGGAYGKGQVYQDGKLTGTSTLMKLSVGFQAGAQAYSQIVFFQDKRAYDEFTSGEFVFDAQASAVAITAGVQAQAGEKGASAGATAGPGTGVQAEKGGYRNGMAVFVHTKGGLMYEAAIGGQKFKFTPIQE
jgi:lipid-binding SYLF domain-containing protein